MSKIEEDIWVGPKYLAPIGQVSIYCQDPRTRGIEFNWTRLDRFHRRVNSANDPSNLPTALICDQTAVTLCTPHELNKFPGLRPLSRYFDEESGSYPGEDILIRINTDQMDINRVAQARIWDRFLRHSFNEEWLRGSRKAIQDHRGQIYLTAALELLSWNLNPRENSLARAVIDLEPKL